MQELVMSAKAEFCNADARVPVRLNGSSTPLLVEELTNGPPKRTS